MPFVKATKKQSFLRLALTGPSGSGKTYSALSLATHLAQGGKVAVIDTERGSASKYSDLFEFDVLELTSFHPKNYIEAIKEAQAAGYSVLIIDSLSHAWSGKDGALELVDRAKQASKTENSFTAWRNITPLQNQLIDAILGASLHVIATLRVKTEYIVETNESGRAVPKKVGMAPIQRDNLEYEFDITGDLTLDNNLIISKTRCPALTGAMIPKPGKDMADVLLTWLGQGAPRDPRLEYWLSELDKAENLSDLTVVKDQAKDELGMNAEIKARYTMRYQKLQLPA